LVQTNLSVEATQHSLRTHSFYPDNIHLAFSFNFQRFQRIRAILKHITNVSKQRCLSPPLRHVTNSLLHDSRLMKDRIRSISILFELRLLVILEFSFKSNHLRNLHLKCERRARKTTQKVKRTKEKPNWTESNLRFDLRGLCSYGTSWISHGGGL
jgi:hypothetical protein